MKFGENRETVERRSRGSEALLACASGSNKIMPKNGGGDAWKN